MINMSLEELECAEEELMRLKYACRFEPWFNKAVVIAIEVIKEKITDLERENRQ